MSEIGCKHIKINELQNVSADLYVSFEKMMKVKMKNPFAYGCQTDISNMFKEYGMKITLKRSCFRVVDRSIAKATWPDLFKCIAQRLKPCNQSMSVLYENGMLENGWLQK